MDQQDGDLTSIGPWKVTGRIYAEGSRTCYRGVSGSLKADITVLTMTTARASALGEDITRSQGILTYEIPKVLDAAIGKAPHWIASDDAPGESLSAVLEEGGPLTPSQWAELAKTALIGCAALRSAKVTSFQLSPNTFMVDHYDIHMSNFWAASLEPGPFTPPHASSVSQLGPTDDKYAIGRILQLAMGANPAEVPTLGDSQGLGYTEAHVEFIQRLIDNDPTTRLSTEAALRDIPGRDPAWTVPVFALDRAWQPRMKRRAQKVLLWSALAGVAALLIVLGVRWLASMSSEGPSAAGVAIAEESSAVPTRVVRIRSVDNAFPDQFMSNASSYQIDFCLPRSELALGSEAPEPRLQQLRGGKWERVERPIALRDAPDCSKPRIQVSVRGVADTSKVVGEDWSPCEAMRVLLPRKDGRKPVAIEYCVEQRTEYR